MAMKGRRRISRLALGTKLIIQGLADVAIEGVRRVSEGPVRGDPSYPQKRGRQAAAPRRETGRPYYGGGAAWLRSAAPGNRASSNARSDTFNPSSPAHRAAASNRSNQLNPNSAAYRSSRGANGKGHRP